MKGEKKSRHSLSDSDDSNHVNPKHENDDSNDIFESQETIIQESPTRTESSIKATFFYEDLSSDDEVYTFQSPSDFKTETLLKVKVDLSEATQIKDKSGDIYNVQLLESPRKSVTCALPSKKKEGALAVIPLAGHIVIKKDFNIPDAKFPGDEDDSVAYPRDLKVRHPLLGVDWEDYIKGSGKNREGIIDDDRPVKKKREKEDDDLKKLPRKKRKLNS